MADLLVSKGFASGTQRVMVTYRAETHVLVAEIDRALDGYVAHFRVKPGDVGFTPWASYVLLENALDALSAFYPGVKIVREV